MWEGQVGKITSISPVTFVEHHLNQLPISTIWDTLRLNSLPARMTETWDYGSVLNAEPGADWLAL
jgi:hypothetical protein